MQILPNSNLKDYIKSNATDEQLFAYFLNTTVNIIVNAINENYKLNNPLRRDAHASLSIFKVNCGNEEKIRFYDWANRKYRGDIFELVGIILKQDVNTGKGFMIICKHIISILPFLEVNDNKSNISEISVHDIYVTDREFNNTDMSFWKPYISEEFIHKNIIAVEYAELDNKSCYTFRRTDPCYAYYLGKYRETLLYQLYFPMRKKPDVRFITNNLYPFMMIRNMKDGKQLFITKSVKDVLVCEYLMLAERKLSLSYGVIPAEVNIVSLSSESIRFDIRIANFLKDKYEEIYINSDFDIAGINCMKFYKNNYGFKPISTWSRTNKDIADLKKYNTTRNTIELLHERNPYLR